MTIRLIFGFLILTAAILYCGRVPYAHAAAPVYEKTEKEDWDVPTKDPLGKLYNEAMELYKQRRYVEAKEKFEQVQTISPEAYPSSKAFLKRIEQHLAHQDANLQEMQKRQELLREKNAQQLAELRASKKKQSEDLRSAYRQAKIKESKSVAAKRQRAQKELMTRAKNRYKNILALSKAKRYIEAKDQLQSLGEFLSQSQLPADFREEMIGKIEKAEALIIKGEAQAKQKEIEKKARLAQLQEKEEAKALQLKEQEQLRVEKALAEEREKALAQEQKEREEKKTAQLLAKQKELELLKSEPKAKKEAVLSRGSPERKSPVVPAAASAKAPAKKKVSTERQQLKAKFAKEIQSLYQDGIELYNTEQWESARDLFGEVEQLWPNYKATRNYLLAIDQSLDDQSKIPSKPREEIIGEALDEYR